MLPSWRDGRVKQAIIARTLALRARAPGLFTQGSYVPLRLEGPFADHALAFARVHEGRSAIVIATRLPMTIDAPADEPLVNAGNWRETAILLPRSLVDRKLVHILDGEVEIMSATRLSLAGMLSRLPVALMELR